ncbi:MAG: low molecular weight protein tyrosine phosphatase family protein [Bacteroidia bacterium]
MNILFICSRNQWRSPTAEAVYKGRPGLIVKSAGTEATARIKLSAKLVLWADIIFAMEKEHKQRLIERFPLETLEKEIIVLNIPDEYKFMDPELVDCIKGSADPYIEEYCG